MAKIMFPDARFRSPTAAPNRSDVRDEMVYSAVRLIGTSGITGVAKAFTVPQGQSIPSMGTDNTSAAAYTKTFSALTTNLTKAGEFGSALGDASVRGIGITVEAMNYSATAGLGTTGAQASEVTSIIHRSAFALRVAGKKQIEQPTWAFPALGGPVAALMAAGGGATTDTNASVYTNGIPGSGRRLKIPIMIARTDTVEGEFNVVDSLGLNAATATCLVWFSLLALIKGDVR